MAKAKIIDGHVFIQCPGCKRRHALNIDQSNGRPAWQFNGDLERPTFAPSLLEKSGHHVPGQPQPPDCRYCAYAKENPDVDYKCGICHSFIRDGMIEFLSDCTHEMSGKTVPLPDWDDVD